MRALLAGEHSPLRARQPVRCFRCECVQKDRPLYKVDQLMRGEWVACLPCGTSGAFPGPDGKPVMPVPPPDPPWAE
ncbi:MAG TPA: hypothetical protein VFS19_01885 [Planctomycetota bacterium]|nr:hypothetical protein [Planctomycetota bacterium]